MHLKEQNMKDAIERLMENRTLPLQLEGFGCKVNRPKLSPEKKKTVKVSRSSATIPVLLSQYTTWQISNIGLLMQRGNLTTSHNKQITSINLYPHKWFTLTTTVFYSVLLISIQLYHQLWFIINHWVNFTYQIQASQRIPFPNVKKFPHQLTHCPIPPTYY